MRRLTNLFSANETDQRVLNTPLPRQANAGKLKGVNDVRY